MVNAAEWAPVALERLKHHKILHRNYESTRHKIQSACSAMMKSELIVLVGPSRVGKTRSLRDALDVFEPNEPDENGRMRVVWVEAGNDSTGGEFSTKAFMAECLRAIRHPIYGVPEEKDAWEERLLARIHRTPEAMLRSALQQGLVLRRTEVMVIDEAHHVRYTAGGNAAASRILDSYKCLANRTNVNLVLSGSYQLQSLLMLAPHLLGRQHPIEFRRYHGDLREDVGAWQQVLQALSKNLLFETDTSLCTWNDYLFEGSLGCIGQLTRWLRAALGHLLSRRGSTLTREDFVRSRSPAVQEEAILAEIIAGEQLQLPAKEDDPQSRAGLTSRDGGEEQVRSPKTTRRKPFQRASRRNKFKGRV